MSNRWPVNVTTVPCWPTIGEMESIEPGFRYAKPLSFVTRAPVSATSVTSEASPPPGGPLPATTTTVVLFSLTTFATGTDPSSTEAVRVPSPCSFVPVIVTRVVAWPLCGTTALIAPGER